MYKRNDTTRKKRLTVMNSDIEHLMRRLSSCGAPRNQAEAILLNKAHQELTVAGLHTTSLNAGMSLAAEFACHAESNVESLLYALRVLRGDG